MSVDTSRAVTAVNDMPDVELEALDPEPRLLLDVGLREAMALRAWLMKSVVDGATSLDDPLVNAVLTQLGREIDVVMSTMNIRRELAQAGLEVAHLSDEQVRELGRRVSAAAQPGLRG